MTYGRFLSRRQGTNLEVEDLLVRDLVYSRKTMRAYLAYTTQKLVMAYIAMVRSDIGTMIGAPAQLGPPKHLSWWQVHK